MSLRFHGIYGDTDLVFRDDNGDEGLTLYAVLVDHKGKYARLQTAPETFTWITSIDESTWASVYAAICTRINFSGGATHPSCHYVPGILFTDDSTIPPGFYTVHILDSNLHDAAIVASIEVYFDGATVTTADRYLRTKADEVKTDTTSLVAGVPVQSRATRPAGKAFRLQASNRNTNRCKATRSVRLTAGAVKDVRVDLDVSPIFGSLYVTTVGTPTLTPLVDDTTGLTCVAVGPSFDGSRRDAQVMLGGTLGEAEQVLVTVEVEVEGGDSDTFQLVVEALPAVTEA